MQVPLSWLKEYVDIPGSTASLVERLTLAGLEVAAVERTGDWWDPTTLVVGQVMAVSPHPDADRLVLVDVDYGGAEPQRGDRCTQSVCLQGGLQPAHAQGCFRPRRCTLGRCL